MISKVCNPGTSIKPKNQIEPIQMLDETGEEVTFSKIVPEASSEKQDKTLDYKLHLEKQMRENKQL